MIRVKNLDFETDGIKPQETIIIGDVTLTRRYAIFVCPYACIVDRVDIVSMQAMLGVSDVSIGVAVQLASATGTLLHTIRRTSASDSAHSDAISAAMRYRLVCTANNSLTAGTIVGLQFSAQGTGVLSAVVAQVTYTPLKNRVR